LITEVITKDNSIHYLVQTHSKLVLMIKRGIDVSLSIILLIILLPFCIPISILIKLTSKGPIIFRQKRCGYLGRIFEFYKFRSMISDVDCLVDIRVVKQMQRDGILFKKRNDPRVTKIGSFLRKASIDELPQLINVIKGDMSLVGPRPLLPFMLEPYKEFAEVRSTFRPGITGLWQVRERENNTKAEHMMKYDLEYIKNFSLYLDFRILALTIFAVFSGKGAH